MIRLFVLARWCLTDSPGRQAVALVALFAWLVGSPSIGTAQCSGHQPDSRSVSLPQFVAADSARLGSLVGQCWGGTGLIRSPAPVEDRRTGLLVVRPLDPILSITWNSKIPGGWNDGAMWAGRGINTSVSGGAVVSYRRLRVVIAPEVVRSQNLPFPVLVGPNPVRSGFASPWHSREVSTDLPLRFGNRPFTLIDPGQTFVDMSVGRVRAGVSSASQWWGPGIRSALVMSNNAGGIPHAFVATASPVATRLGDFEAYWMLGGLQESPFFDYDSRNDLRALSAAVVTFRTAVDSGLTIGAARSVYSPVRRFGGLPEHFADVFIDWHVPGISGRQPRSDQLTSFFGRWVFPAAGFAMHGEWAKLRPPKSGRELLVNPQHGQGYTLGLEWATPVANGSHFRLQAEATMLEQTPEKRLEDVSEFYASYSVLQGYTQKGQVIGAFIGPGSSSQYLGADYFRSTFQMGAALGRIRWEESAYYRTLPGSIAGRAHDVSLLATLKARVDTRWLAADASLTRTLRMNYLFQSVNPYVRGPEFDVRNLTLSVGLVPHLPR